MSYLGAYERINWENYPSTNTPLGEDNLNSMDYTIKKHDTTLEAWDGPQGKANKSDLSEISTEIASKASQSDMLQAIKSISYNDSNGVLTITKFNNTSVNIDTKLEKLAVNFDYDDNPSSAHYQELIITLDDGTVKYVDMSSLVTQYEFTDSSIIDFTVGPDGKISATVIDGSIPGTKLQPNYLADVTAQATSASNSAKDSEAWAKGTRNGTPVGSSDVTYHNNSKYYAETIVGSASDSEAYAVGTRNGIPVTSDDPAYHNNARYWAEVGSLPDVKSATLTAGSTTVQFTDMPSSGDYFIQFYTSVPGLDYTDINVNGSTVTLTYAAQSADIIVKCEIREIVN